MRTLIFLLTHQDHQATRIRLETWAQVVPREDILIVGDHAEEEFARIEHPHKVRSVDPRRKTRDHQRELQSYTKAYQAVAQWMAGQDFTHVFMVEYDLFPLRRDVTQLLHETLNRKGADVLCHKLLRVDGTGYAHYLYHHRMPGFTDYWAKISRRPDPSVVLSMLGNGTYWSRQAFDQVARYDEPFPMYLELYLPTLAHHLGYRLVDITEAGSYVSDQGDRFEEIPAAQAQGAWYIHPIKTIREALQLPR